MKYSVSQYMVKPFVTPANQMPVGRLGICVEGPNEGSLVIRTYEGVCRIGGEGDGFGSAPTSLISSHRVQLLQPGDSVTVVIR